MRARADRTLFVVLSLLLAGPADAAIDEYAEQGKNKADSGATVVKGATPAKVPWRNSLVIYENTVSAYSLDKGAQPEYDPTYVQSLSFRPRFYLRDDLSLRARLDLQIELTDSNSTDHAREWILSDLTLGAVYTPKWMVIPKLGIQVSPSLNVTFPTSIVSRSRTLMFAIAPGVAFRRQFSLLKGRFLKSIGLMYGFRAYKYFNEYTTQQVSRSFCPRFTADDASCVQTGDFNPSWRFGNTFEVRVQLLDKLSLTVDLMLINDLDYPGEGGIASGSDGITHVYTRPNNPVSASVWGLIDVSYDVLDWLWLSAGISSYHPQLELDSDGYRTPFFNRFTMFYFDVTVPVDRFVSQVQSWVR